MENVTIETTKPVADAQSGTLKTKVKKASTRGTAGKKAKPAKKAPRAKKPARKPTAERTNKKAEVIAMMKRAKGAALTEIVKATGWQKPGGRPRRFPTVPPRASIARLSFSRSATSSARMCSVGIRGDRSTRTWQQSS
jgi:hypothetical protein